MKRALRVSLALSLVLPALLPPKVLSVDCSNPEVAKESFSSAYALAISVDEQGAASISQKVTLKNLTGDCYVSEYAMTIKSSKVRDVFGKDSDGKLNINVNNDGAATKIVAKLNKLVTKKDSTTDFSLDYTVDDLARKEGNIWSLIAYRINASERIDAYEVKILVPVSFGAVFSVSPVPDSISQSGGKTVLTFGKNSLSYEGISAKFGDRQQISFKFRIPLENRSFFKKNLVAIIPPDGDRQQTLINKLDPSPKKIFLDKTGNFETEYQLDPSSFLEAKVEGVASVVGKSSYPSVKVFNESELAAFKEGGRFVQVQDKIIQEKSKELKEPLKIYNFVTNYLSYNYQAISAGQAERSGASVLLRKKKPATSLDFVDLFVSLVKATGVPAREVFGLVVSADESTRPVFIASPLNTKALHVWAQFYDAKQKIWIDVDPTWGSTSGADYFGQGFSDRLVLFYSSAGDDLRLLESFLAVGANIEAAYFSEKVSFSPKVELTTKVDQAFAGFPATVLINLENKSGVSLINNSVNLLLDGVTLIGNKNIDLPIIFPYEKKVLRFKIRGGNLVNDLQGQVKVLLKGKAGGEVFEAGKTIKVKVQPFFSLGVQQVLLLIIILLLAFCFFAQRRGFPEKFR